ncbi:hypothetical protein TNCV_3460551 [Trichonephila clavipes]|nr:hypothetical protein TNCV_3460551 [Trichonephila clavipes]
MPQLRYECIMHSSLIDECRITEFFSSYIVNSVKHICSSAPDRMMTWRPCDEYDLLYDLRVGGYPLHLRPSQRKLTCSVRLYGERYPTCQQPLNQQTFSRVHQNLAEHGSFKGSINDTLVNLEMDLVNLGGRTGKILRTSSVALKSKNQEINRLQLAVKLPWAIFESVDILS